MPTKFFFDRMYKYSYILVNNIYNFKYTYKDISLQILSYFFNLRAFRKYPFEIEQFLYFH